MSATILLPVWPKARNAEGWVRLNLSKITNLLWSIRARFWLMLPG
jgi:hypothetical protein